MTTNLAPDSGTQTRYDIQKLLDEAIQPFDELTNEELDGLAASIGRRQDPLAVPVVLSRDGQLIDGSQRLRALQKFGRKYIDATNVRIAPQITSANALEWAIRLGVQRRQLGVREKGKLVRTLMAKNGWSQGRCAKVFGVSSAAVSQWLGQTQPSADEQLPEYVVGEDGVMQDVSAKRRARLMQRTTPHPWSAGGESFKLVEKTSSRIDGTLRHQAPLDELSPDERDDMQAVLATLLGVTQNLLAVLERD